MRFFYFILFDKIDKSLISIMDLPEGSHFSISFGKKKKSYCHPSNGVRRYFIFQYNFYSAGQFYIILCVVVTKKYSI